MPSPMKLNELRGTDSAGKYFFKLAALSAALGIATLSAQEVDEIVVVGVTPNGTGVDRNKVPFPVQTATAEEIDEAIVLGMTDLLRQNFASVSVNDAQNNPLQADLQYRGFTASPLLGLAQGLAVYQGGVRINEPLGDAVNWDLLPESAINGITLIGGSSPLFGLNSLGGSLVVDMKDGFNYSGSALEVSSGSFGRSTANFETGRQIGSFAYYGNIQYFEEDGWRDHSSSEALNFYGSLGWQTESATLELNYQMGDSELVGNGSSPRELLALDREAIFTGPDITENDMQMFSIDYSQRLSEKVNYRANLFFRENDTDAFNGDGSEFAVCGFGGGDQLIEGIEEDDLEEIGLDDDDICDGQFASPDALEDFLNMTALANAVDEEFDLDSFEADDLSGTGVLSDDATNNLSDRSQESSGADFQWAFDHDLFGRGNQLIVGLNYFKGESVFNSRVELARIDPISRLTQGLGVGTFVDEGETSIATKTQTSSIYLTNALDLNDELTLTLSARMNNTDVKLRDISGERPELNGKHDYFRVNPAIGLNWNISPTESIYASISQSSRAPTPIELACNEGVFDLAVQFAVAAGEDPDDVELECRLPNAFLADPPLDDVVARNMELGLRGSLALFDYQASVFHTTNRNDILFQTTGRATGLFANVDETQRSGFEAAVNGRWSNTDWFLAYSFVAATFEDNFQVLSPNHDFADDEGNINVRKGDRMPGIPENQLKAGFDYHWNERFSLGLNLVNYSDQIIRGDESNQLDTVSAYTVVGLRARYHIGDKLQAFLKVENLFDEDYESFGLLGEEPGELEVPIIEDLTDPIFLGAGAPRAAFVGLRYQF
ncbi:MAG: membrane protein [Pseudohongiella sp.]|nr:MAG: membrane protein [Pseudohongiella sp.]